MASLEDREKANGARLSRLLIDTGTEAMRNVFDSIHLPATLTATLNSNRRFLQSLPVINRSQMDVLFPPSGAPSQSMVFDITLLFILLRNICGLHPPASTGSWDANPPSTDTTREANLARIKYYRNKVYGHNATTGVDDATFHSYWNDISAAVVGLGVSEEDVKLLKFAPLEENLYLDQMKEWKEKEDKLEVMLNESLQIQSETSTKLEGIFLAQQALFEGQKETMETMSTLSSSQKETNSKLNIMSEKLDKGFQEAKSTRCNADTVSTLITPANAIAFSVLFLHTFLKICVEKNTDFPKPYLPDKVPNFTGREAECNEIVDAMTSESIRIVSIWGPPGFGKTSIANEVSRRLNSSESPAYFVNLRGKRSEKDLVSSLLGIFRSAALRSNLSPADELYCQLEKIPCRFYIILDNLDDILQSNASDAERFSTDPKDEVFLLLDNIRCRCRNVTFLITSRQSLEFLNLKTEGTRSVKIELLDQQSADQLVNKLLHKISNDDLAKTAKLITQVCGNMPLAILLLCSYINESKYTSSDCLARFLSSPQNVIDKLDNMYYTSDLRLEKLFDFSFLTLSQEEKEAFVSVSVFNEDFDLNVAQEIIKTSSPCERVLEALVKTSLLQESSQTGFYSFHPLILLFARKKGEREMKKVAEQAKARFCNHYIDRLDELNMKLFLNGKSHVACNLFFRDRQHIIRSLMEGCSDKELCKRASVVLSHAELFLAVVFMNDYEKLRDVYDYLLKWTKKHDNVSCSRLLLGKSFYEITWGSRGGALAYFSKIKQCDEADEIRAKRLCYEGIYTLVYQNPEHGLQLLEQGLQLLNENTGPDSTILKALIFQIVAIHYKVTSHLGKCTKYCRLACQECKKAGDLRLFFVSIDMNNVALTRLGKKPDQYLTNQPLILEFIFLLSVFHRQLGKQNGAEVELDECTKQMVSALPQIELGLKKISQEHNKLFYPFVRFVYLCWDNLKQHEKAIEHLQAQICEAAKKGSCQTQLLADMYFNLGNMLSKKKDYDSAIKAYQNSLELRGQEVARKSEIAEIYQKLWFAHFRIKEYSLALKSQQEALDIRLEVYGKEHTKTADSYCNIGVTLSSMEKYSLALESLQQALDIRLKVHGKEHAKTADSYRWIGDTLWRMANYSSALESHQKELEIRLKVHDKEHAATAATYHKIGITLSSMRNYFSALESHQQALDIRLKVHGHEHKDTADSYHDIGVTLSRIRNYSSALESLQQALNIRLKVHGQEHEETADSYREIGDALSRMRNYSSALESLQQALNIRLKVHGKEHEETANSYHDIGVTLSRMRNYSSALESHQQALDIRLKVHGQEHEKTADSYRQIGDALWCMANYSSALESHQKELDIRLKVHGKENEKTADCYREIGVTLSSMREYSSAVKSHQHALDIRLKIHGKEHKETADSYHDIGVTLWRMDNNSLALKSYKEALDIRLKVHGKEHAATAATYHEIGKMLWRKQDYSSALESLQQALDVRLKIHGKEHDKTADSYHDIGVTLWHMDDNSLALKSYKEALDIRIKVHGHEHAATASTYHEIGITLSSMRDYSSALESLQQALDVRLKVHGREHEKTADSYREIGITLSRMENYSSALECLQQALDIRLKIHGKEHEKTADSYHDIGVTLWHMDNNSFALKSYKEALDIRLKVHGQEHAATASTYHELGITLSSMRNYFSALESLQQALNIRLKVHSKEHEETANSYHDIGVTLSRMRNYSSALESHQQALDIRLKIHGQEHEKTVDSYREIGITLSRLENYSSALEWLQQALDIRLKIHGKEYEKTADSYHDIGITLWRMGDYSSALESHQQALDIRLKVHGKEHAKTANSYREIEITLSHQEGVDIRSKVRRRYTMRQLLVTNT